MPKLSVTVITKNEAGHIGPALESVSWADEIIVVDAQSTDETVSIARRHASSVVVRAWPGYSAQKNHAAGLAQHDWILSLDADERIPPGLAEEIQHVLRTEPASRGFRIPRVAYHLGRWIRSTDWYPDRQLRLYDRRAGRWLGSHVHESVSVDGPVGHLEHEIQHFAYRNLAHHLETIDRYTSLAARQLVDEGALIGPLDLAVRPPLAFVRNYVLRGGFRDGMPGLVVSSMNAYYVLLKFAKAWELGHDSTREP